MGTKNAVVGQFDIYLLAQTWSPQASIPFQHRRMNETNVPSLCEINSDERPIMSHVVLLHQQGAMHDGSVGILGEALVAAWALARLQHWGLPRKLRHQDEAPFRRDATRVHRPRSLFHPMEHGEAPR